MLFRKIFFQKLTEADVEGSVNKVGKPTKAASKKGQLNFNVVKPQAEFKENDQIQDVGDDD